MADTKDERARAWWAAWWEADYSWAGLARKPVGENGRRVHGGLHGERTLQDYWRRDPETGAVRDDASMRAAGELVDCDGVPFHIVHLPPATKAGAPTWKADLGDSGWEKCEALIAARVAAGAETAVDSWADAHVPDGRAQLAGAVLRSAAAHPQGKQSPQHLEVSLTAWLGGVDYRETLFGPGARFHSATFSGDARFDSATFSGSARFESARFSGDAWFQSATFSEDARFESATFSGDAGFESASFSGYAGFESSTFSGYVWFGSATFWGDASFASATLSGNVSFHSAAFWGAAVFDRATISGQAAFQSAMFSGYARFEGAKFTGDVGFQSATFSGVALFQSATFLADAWFHWAAFAGYAGFDRCVFRSVADFTGAARTPRREGSEQVLEFAPATAEGGFAGALKMPAGLEPIARAGFQRCSFERAIFHDTANFSNRAFTALARFDSAEFRGVPIFHDAVIGQGVRLHLAKFDLPWRTADAWADAQIADARKAHREMVTEAKAKNEDPPKAELPSRQSLLDARFAELELAFRTLKLAMENIRDRDREQTFYRYELICRRRQSTTFWGERLFSQGYGLIANYGGSLFRPIATLAILTVLFGLGYWAWAAALQDRALVLWGPGGVQNDAWDALLFSANNVFRPFNAWGAEADQSAWLKALLAARTGEEGVVHGGGWRLAIRLVATLQSLFAIVLAFLFALAVRRRFQIS